ncbi:MAG: AEC family transporter [Clostridia bacterium]|nr:AEC family transporter [Clostridia bacterium]
MSVIEQVITLFLIALIGALCRHLRFFTDETIHGLTSFVVNITLPFLTYTTLQRPFSEDILKGFLLTMVLTGLVLVFCLVVSWNLFRKRPLERRSVIANLCTFSNCGFMGYPIIMAINPDLMIYAAAYNVSFCLLSWTYGVHLFTGENAFDFRKILKNPTIISCIIGFIVFCTGFTLPSVPYDVLKTIGDLTTPLTMLLIGTRIYGIKISELRDPDYHLVSAFRLIIFPLLVFLLRFLPINPDIVTVLFVLTAMPCATVVSMQAELYHGDVLFSARTVAWSTLLSIITVPLLCLLL